MRPRGVLVALVMVAACGSDRETRPIHGLSVDGSGIGVHDNCHDDPRLEVDADTSTIELTFSIREASGGDCLSCTVVTLDDPVGERTVVDVATGEPLRPDGLCFEPA